MYKKLAILALFLGVASAYDTSSAQTLPTWEIDQSCNPRLEKESHDIAVAIQEMPRDKVHQKAVLYVAKYFQTMENLCVETPTGFYCPNSVQDNIIAAQNDMVHALQECNSPQANQLLIQIAEFFSVLDQCSTVVSSNAKVMIKIQLPPAGQKALKKETMEFEFELRKFKQSPHAHRIRQNMRQFAHSQEARDASQAVGEFMESKEAQKVHDALLDAQYSIDDATEEIDNGVEVDNGSLPEIEQKLENVGDAVEEAAESHWGSYLKDVLYKALTQNNIKTAHEELRSYLESAKGDDLLDEGEDVGEALNDNVAITDLPDGGETDLEEVVGLLV